MMKALAIAKAFKLELVDLAGQFSNQFWMDTALFVDLISKNHP